MKTAIMKKISFSDSQSVAIGRIQQDGNLTGHFASRRLGEGQKFEDNVMKADFGTTAESWRKTANQIEGKLKIWVSQEQAFADLKDTSSILLTVFRALPR